MQQVPTRTYPEGGLAAHLFGYVGEIQESQLERPEFCGTRGRRDRRPGRARARLQRAASWAPTATATSSSTASAARSTSSTTRVPTDGQRLQLTIDYDLQRALEDGFHATGFAGAAAFLDPRNGEILAMTSLPAYDPERLRGRHREHEVGGAQQRSAEAADNRLIQGRYSPGSTFKIVMAVAALEEGVITPDFKFFCPGSGTFYGRPFKCSRKGGHGRVDLRHAIEQSCNVYFYKVGDLMKIDTIHKYAAKLGLSGKTGIDLPGENASLVPSTEWSKRVRKQPWYPGETISVVDRPGRRVGHAARAGDDDRDGRQRRHAGHAAPGQGDRRRRQGLAADAGAAAAIAVQHPPGRARRPCATASGWSSTAAGTARRSQIAGRDVCRQDRHRAGHLARRRASRPRARSTSATTACSCSSRRATTRRSPGIVFAEHGEHGSSAAPIAKHVLETFFAKQEGRPLPVLAARQSSPRRSPARRACRAPRTPRNSRNRSEPRRVASPEPMIVERRLSAAPRLAARRGRRRAHARRAGHDLQRHLECPHQPARRRVLDAGLRAADRARRAGAVPA